MKFLVTFEVSMSATCVVEAGSKHHAERMVDRIKWGELEAAGYEPQMTRRVPFEMEKAMVLEVEELHE